jgi:hypothetical protein
MPSQYNSNSFTTAGPIEVALEVIVGRVELVASDRSDVTVDVLPRNENRAGDVNAAKSTSVTFADGRLTIATPKGLPLIGPKDNVVVEIALPTGSRVGGKVGYSTLRAQGRYGEVRITGGYGDIDFDETDSLHVKAGGGNITVGDIHGDAEIIVSNGDVRVDRIDGSAVLKVTNGDIVVREVTGEVEAASSTGGVTIDRVGKETYAKVAYGRVRIGHVAEGSVRLESSYGELEVGIPEGTAAWLDVSSQHGSVRNDLTGAAAPTEGTPTVQVRARSNWGDVVIRRPKNAR